MNSEKLTLSVDVLTGLIMVHIPQYENCPFVDEIQQSIKKDLINFENLISDLRIWVVKERFKKTAEYFFTVVQEQLPFSTKEQNPVIRNRHQKLYFQFLKNIDYYLLVVFTDQTDNSNVVPEYYILNVEQTNIEYENKFKIDLDEINKSFLIVKSLIKLNMNCILKQNEIKEVNEAIKYYGKRKFDEIETNLNFDRNNGLNQNNQKNSGFFITELIYLLSFSEEKMAYSFLSSELQKRGFCHHIRSNCYPFYARYIDIIQMPPTQNIKLDSRLHRNLISCSINLQGKFNKIWVVNYKFSNEEIPENLSRNNAIKNMISITFDILNNSQQQIVKFIDDMINDWIQFSKLYEILIQFTKLTNYTSYLDKFEFNLFNYKKIVLNYGPNLNYTVKIVWKTYENKYALNFGIIDSTITTNNPHVIVSVQLQDEFNQHKSIASLIKVLNLTVNSLSTIHQITCIPMLGLMHAVS
jgi:mediator of RNA polymerase II transcription subunit 14